MSEPPEPRPSTPGDVAPRAAAAAAPPRSGVAARLAGVRARIEAAAARAGRSASDVRLLAVSKGVGAEGVREALDAGQRDFGENYAQELGAKAEAFAAWPLGDRPRFHFIGQLQRNKAGVVARHAASVQSVDRLELGRALDARRAEAGGGPLDVLVEVHLGDEASKGGCAPDRCAALIDGLRALPRLEVRGLMAIPPASDDPRRHFAALRALRDALGGEPALPELSMGMSGDFEIAIEEGATIVRVGTAIFGPRPAPRRGPST